MEKNSWYSIQSSKGLTEVCQRIIKGFEDRDWTIEVCQGNDPLMTADNTTIPDNGKKEVQTEIQIVRYPKRTSLSEPIPIIVRGNNKQSIISTLDSKHFAEYKCNENKSEANKWDKLITIIEESIN